MRTSRKPDPFTRRLRSTFLERAASFCPHCRKGKAPLRVVCLGQYETMTDRDPSRPHEWRHPRLGSEGAVSWVICHADSTWEQFEHARKGSQCLADEPVN